mmetsp:Transcript_2603/g.10044  ORF Transcript_2603/g.10044 Transcript_2603/m.10044 type:complete len:274 (-) Transcript_2603:73-894(-)
MRRKTNARRLPWPQSFARPLPGSAPRAPSAAGAWRHGSRGRGLRWLQERWARLRRRCRSVLGRPLQPAPTTVRRPCGVLPVHCRCSRQKHARRDPIRSLSTVRHCTRIPHPHRPLSCSSPCSRSRPSALHAGAVERQPNRVGCQNGSDQCSRILRAALPCRSRLSPCSRVVAGTIELKPSLGVRPSVLLGCQSGSDTSKRKLRHPTGKLCFPVWVMLGRQIGNGPSSPSRRCYIHRRRLCRRRSRGRSRKRSRSSCWNNFDSSSISSVFSCSS